MAVVATVIVVGNAKRSPPPGFRLRFRQSPGCGIAAPQPVANNGFLVNPDGAKTAGQRGADAAPMGCSGAIAGQHILQVNVDRLVQWYGQTRLGDGIAIITVAGLPPS